MEACSFLLAGFLSTELIVEVTVGWIGGTSLEKSRKGNTHSLFAAAL
jgi:hypothetical protein